MFPLLWVKDDEKEAWIVAGLGAGDGARVERRADDRNVRPFAWIASHAGTMTGGTHGEFPCTHTFEGYAKTAEEGMVRARWALVGLGVLGDKAEIRRAIVAVDRARPGEDRTVGVCEHGVPADTCTRPHARAGLRFEGPIDPRTNPPRRTPEINPENGHGAADGFAGQDTPHAPAARAEGPYDGGASGDSDPPEVVRAKIEKLERERPDLFPKKVGRNPDFKP